jgi:glycosyltransferase involved in cell wall biosynthesis
MSDHHQNDPAGMAPKGMRGRPLAGRRMLIVAPDDYPAFRVDLTELFSRHLVGRGLHIDWSLHRVDDGPASIDDRGSERYILPARRPGGILAKLRNRLSNGAERWRLVWRAARGDYDIVQVRDYTFWGLPFHAAARIARKPFVFWMSYPVMEARWLLAVRPFRPIGPLGRAANFLHALAGKATFYRFLRHADHVVVQSKRMRERLEKKGVARESMTPVEMGVTTERFNPDVITASRDPRLTGRRVITYVCSLHFGEPFDVALGALAAARRRGHDAVLVAVGVLADHEREALAGKLAALGIPQDAFISTGMLPLAEALGYVKAADLCISPFQMNAEQEVATPTKLVEYLAMGRPVVASVHYDQSEVIGRSGAGLVAAFEGEATGEAIARILADREWAEEMGARGPAWVKANRDYGSLADRVERLYAGVIAARSAHAVGGVAMPAE